MTDSDLKKGSATLKYGLMLLPPLLLAGVMAALVLRLCVNAGDFLPPGVAAAKISRTYGLYAPPGPAEAVAFSKALYLLHKPDIAALGPARAAYMPGDVFAAPFTLVAGLHGLAQLRDTLGPLLDAHAPRAVILALDPVWFAPGSSPLPEKAGKARRAARTLGLLLSGKIGIADIQYILRGDMPDAGLDAILARAGLDRAGTRHADALVTGRAKSGDAGFGKTLGLVEKGAGPFAARGVDAEKWRLFLSVLDMLEERGVASILLLPPYAPRVADAAGGDRHADLHARLSDTARARNLHYYNFTDPRAFGVTDCAFIDGLTVGAAGWNRLLLRMALGDAHMREALDLPRLGHAIHTHPDRATTHAEEADFLGLGCGKEGKAGGEGE